MAQPVPTGMAQNKTGDAKVNQQREDLIREKIAANVDTINSLLNAKALNLQRKQVAQRQPKVKYYQKLRIDTLYVDTCISNFANFRLLDRIPEKVAIKKTLPVVKKIKWYQFKKLREERRQRRLNNKK